MSLIDFILNVAGVLMWFNWRALPFDPLSKTTPATLTGTLRRAAPSRFRRWHLPVTILGLIFLRAVFYRQIGPAVEWTARLNLEVVTISFRSDYFERMLIFSILSFTVALMVFFLWLLFLSLLQRPAVEADTLQRLLRTQLGWVDTWPRGLKLFVPLLAGGFLWWLASWPLNHWAIMPRVSALHRLEQALVIGTASYLTWKFLIVAILGLHLINSYVYLGRHPFWHYLNTVARTLLGPLRRLPLRLGKVDFAPVLGIALVFFGARLLEIGLTRLYPRLPL
jgi:uncharacterized protein YggT (Ycf19 family)